MTPEVHAVILWSTALNAVDRIVSDMRERFESVGSYRIEWSRERFAENLRRFYGFALPERVDKTLGSGVEPFLLYVIRDPAPVYGARARSWGVGAVNVATYDAKERYREWTGGGFRVHTTTTRAEGDRDIYLLLGRRATSFVDAESIDWARPPETWPHDVLGADGWRSREELLTALDLTTGYVMLREPATLIVGDLPWARDLAGSTSGVEFHAAGNRMFHAHWQRAILREATRDELGRRVATPEHRFHARLFDAVVSGVPVPAKELAELAAQAGAPDGPYSNVGFAEAVLGDFLHRNGWLRPPDRPLGRRILSSARSRLLLRRR